MATQLGKPAITTPRALDLRAMQQAIDNIRERFQRLEAVALQVDRTVAAAPTTGVMAGMRQEIASLRSELDALSRAVAQQAALTDDAPDASGLIANLRNRINDPDPQPQAPSRAALARLEARIDAIEQEPL